MRDAIVAQIIRHYPRFIFVFIDNCWQRVQSSSRLSIACHFAIYLHDAAARALRAANVNPIARSCLLTRDTGLESRYTLQGTVSPLAKDRVRVYA